MSFLKKLKVLKESLQVKNNTDKKGTNDIWSVSIFNNTDKKEQNDASVDRASKHYPCKF